ncbi:hypothetical protein [Brevundimonas goettingensis]|uniref:Uncharacterized protein n=1 Tax=Brevundimonas goettingensis TaxID=2774190 RepID=A0A975C2W9_9CAUL|nr:hypothetical protein [Brevundimonas goettingensis]QTC92851.1 hypothetical protein IFJ75_08415 [Brevundimonas goettingensis]
MKGWKTLPNGDLEVSLMRSIETASDPEGAVAIRIEHERVAGQLEVIQLAMSPEDAEAMGRELIEVAQLMRLAKGRA